jgi:flagellar biosynthesis/type III secretory pathway protein FliH
MNSNKPPVRPKVLRQPAQNLGVRRLPGLEGEARADQTHEPDISVTLREAFALELAELERQSRDRGLADAGKQARAQLTEALAQQEQQWLKKEASLRAALETERLQLAQLVDALRTQQKHLVSTMEPSLGRLALAVVTRMLGQHDDTRSLIADMARHAIEEYQLAEPLRIRVARADFETLLRLAPDDALLKAFVVDPQASPGSCLIDFEGGQLEVGVQSQLARVASVLTEQGAGRVAGA